MRVTILPPEWHAPVPSLSLAVPGCSRLFPAVPGCSRLFPAVLAIRWIFIVFIFATRPYLCHGYSEGLLTEMKSSLGELVSRE